MNGGKTFHSEGIANAKALSHGAFYRSKGNPVWLDQGVKGKVVSGEAGENSHMPEYTRVTPRNPGHSGELRFFSRVMETIRRILRREGHDQICIKNNSCL